MNLPWKTYDDWRVAGYQVKRGEKGSPSKRKDGKKLFSNKQVKPRMHRGDYDNEADYVADDFWNYDGYFDNIGDK